MSKLQKLIWRDCGVQPSDCLEEEGESLLFSSILKRLQSKISQHVGDTSRGVVFAVLVDEVSCTSLDVLLVCQCHFAAMGPRLQRCILKKSGQGDVGCFPAARGAEPKILWLAG